MNLLLETIHQTQAGVLYFREFAPCLLLRPHVVCFWSGDKAAYRSSYAHRVLPDGCTDIIFDLRSDSGGAVVIGPMCRSRVVVSDLQPALGVRFFPGSAITFLDASLMDLQERVVPLGEFQAAAANRLMDQLRAAGGLSRQILLVENWLLSCLQRTRSDPHVTQALKWIYAERGRLSVSELAANVGLCERQLRRKFPAWTGYAPKLFVRLMRFQHAVESMLTKSARDDAAVAAAHGYADQAHMIHDFQEFGGSPPRAFRRQIHSDTAECPIFSIPTPGTLRYHREP